MIPGIRRNAFAGLAVLIFTTAASAQTANTPNAPKLDNPQVRLWSGDAPGSEGVKATKELMPSTDGLHRLKNIHQPSMTVFLPPAGKSNGSAYVICPSGGHTHLTMDPEYDRARELNQWGIAAFVLEYRLAKTEGFHYRVEVESLHDAQRAVRIIRARSKEWGVDPGRIGIMGASAGGEIAALASISYDDGDPAAADLTDRFSSSVNSAVLISAALTEQNFKFARKPPATFLVVANDDRLSQAAGEYYLALKKAAIPAEMHVFARGGHSLGTVGMPAGTPPLPVLGWMKLLRAWMQDTGIVPR